MPIKSVSSSLAAFLLSLCCILAQGQIAETSPISTDRPSVGSGSDLVPVHSLQVENGIAVTRDQGTNSFDGFESMIRYGFSDRLELQAITPNGNWTSPASGLHFGDLSLGGKVKIGSSAQKWPLAIVGSLSIPTGSSALTSGAVDPSLTVATGRSLPLDLQFSSSAELTSLSIAGQGRSLETQLAFGLGWCARSASCFFVEEAPLFSATTGASAFTTDAGMTVRIRPLLQLDWRVGTTMQNGDRSTFASLGYSIRRDRR